MEPSYIFHDRAEAGRALVPKLRHHAGRAGVVIVGVGRGGLRVAHEVARGLDAPLDLLTVARIRLPGHDYITIGAVSAEGACVLDKSRIAAAQLSAQQVGAARAEAVRGALAREARFRGDHAPIDLCGQVVIVVDDGMVSGTSMRLSLALVRSRRPHAVVAASPVASEEACASLTDLADACVYLATPVPVGTLALWYHDFAAPDDATIKAMLAGEPLDGTTSLAERRATASGTRFSAA